MMLLLDDADAWKDDLWTFPRKETLETSDRSFNTYFALRSGVLLFRFILLFYFHALHAFGTWPWWWAPSQLATKKPTTEASISARGERLGEQPSEGT